MTLELGGDDPLVLLTPGPAGTSPAVKEALTRGDWCHREAEFRALLDGIRRDLAQSLGVGETHEALLVTGSGTAAMELAVIGAVREGRALLALRNGVYGDRLAHIAQAHGITVHSVHRPWTEAFGPELVRAALAEHPDIDAVSCVQHETTTGLVNPVDEIGAVVREHGAAFVLDAISATAIENVGHEQTGGSFIGGTANKGLHGIPGMSFVLLDAFGEARLRAAPRRSVYFDGAAHLDAQRRGEVLFTPAVQVCFALAEAIAEFQKAGGFEARTALYRQRAAQLRGGLAKLGLRPIIAEPHRANSVSMFPLPPRVSYAELHDALRREGFVIYAGQAGYAAGHFRVATMGELPSRQIERFVASLEAVLPGVGSAP
ncbi:aminotransferase class V-fold PLP-dependent enzyme [Micromonospora aurantiaca]|uniref:pyridoxal-phosphate-dependent aminotransferase family protein n=1 Tax=Micromonospora aurantiaca (nom. illeg.) TaxID=47850 RepID=UPI003451D367